MVEPILYGQHTGLSPVAVVIATLFWTMLWGPVGLLLATPLTVCLVVIGKHMESLRFIEILLGDEPALEPEERFYQRVLAGDANEAADQAEQQLKKIALSDYYDNVPMKALLLAQADAAHGKLSRDKQVGDFATLSRKSSRTWKSFTTRRHNRRRPGPAKTTRQRRMAARMMKMSRLRPPCRCSRAAGCRMRGSFPIRCCACPAAARLMKSKRA